MKVNMAKNKRGPGGIQCDQIGHFIGVWETFGSNQSLIFLVKSFLGNFYRNFATFYWSHWCRLKIGVDQNEST